MRLCDIRQKEVINICTCRSLGCVADIDIDECNGCIIAIIIPGPGKICSFLGRDTEYVIPWKCIKQIGDDIILVEIDEEEVLIKCG
jgi:YlmC/YmxH family sporulation protein